MSERQANEILALFDSHIAQGFYRRVPLSAVHLLKARQLISDADNSLRTLDAAFGSSGYGVPDDAYGRP